MSGDPEEGNAATEEEKKEVIEEKLDEEKVEDGKTVDFSKQQEAVTVAVTHVLNREVSENLTPYFGMLFMGVIQCIALGASQNTTHQTYGLIAALVTIALSIAALIIILLERSNHKKGDDQPTFYAEDRVVPGYPVIMKVFSYFLLPWNFICSCILTFGVTSPFHNTGNGYFASWGVVIFAIMAVGITVDNVTGTFKALNYQIGLLLACFLVFFDSISFVSLGNIYPQYGSSLFALILPILTAIIIPVFIYLEHKKVEKFEMVKFPFLIILAIVWFVQACCATFAGPFLTTGNGYFGSWAGAIAAALVAKHAAPVAKENTEETED